ncbi:DNA-binding protein HEXBP-like [Senna tora]|uniref:DNA-binding protein HEXBP-like n=1 Tax=Senna tora TaxID=362788 RepID=A0A834XFE3_9FABA|nr:DNA-binding protein HEXBP-like [Senna tora]
MREMAEAMKRKVDAAYRVLQHIQGDRDDKPQGHRARDEVVEKVKQGTNFSNKRPMNFSKGGSSKGKKPMVSKSAPNSCANCGKTHGGRPCLFSSNVCYTCGQTGHYARDYPQKKQTSERA